MPMVLSLSAISRCTRSGKFALALEPYNERGSERLGTPLSSCFLPHRVPRTTMAAPKITKVAAVQAEP
jgi:hypothetical protein